MEGGGRAMKGDGRSGRCPLKRAQFGRSTPVAPAADVGARTSRQAFRLMARSVAAVREGDYWRAQLSLAAVG